MKISVKSNRLAGDPAAEKPAAHTPTADNYNYWYRIANERQLQIESDQEKIGELVAALEGSIKLQSHYAALLNMNDGGKRLQFANAQAWIDRIAAITRAESDGGGS